MIAVQSLVLSMINYCIRIWATTNITLINKVQKLQNFAARVSAGNVRKYDHISPTFKNLKWLKIKDKYVLDVCIFVFKILKNKVPDWLYTLPTTNSISGITTRQGEDLFIQRTRTDMGKKQVNIRGPYLFNKLPQSVKDAGSVLTFNDKLKNFLQNEFS